MNYRSLNYQAGVLAVLCLLISYCAAAKEPLIPPCELPMGSACSSIREAISYPGNLGPQSYCPQSAGYICVLKALAVPPAPAWIQCHSTSAYSSTCSAWPRGDMQYDWTSSHGLYIPGGTSGPTIQANCLNSHGNGLVSVEITTTQGMKETVFAGVQCGNIQY